MTNFAAVYTFILVAWNQANAVLGDAATSKFNVLVSVLKGSTYAAAILENL